jgi:transcriptional regulator NrdR family protein
MTCPVCGGATAVIDTNPSEDSVRRKRKCRECDFRFTTIEIDEDLYENCRNTTVQLR